MLDQDRNPVTHITIDNIETRSVDSMDDNDNTLDNSHHPDDDNESVETDLSEIMGDNAVADLVDDDPGIIWRKTHLLMHQRMTQPTTSRIHTMVVKLRSGRIK